MLPRADQLQWLSICGVEVRDSFQSTAAAPDSYSPDVPHRIYEKN